MNKKHISLMLAALMCFTSIIPSFAYDLDEKGDSIEEIEYQNTEDEDYTNVTNVFAEIGSEYKVTIPKVIVLSGVTKSADYYVKVEGDIAGYETVNVVPDESVNLYTSNKQPQIGVITQDKTSWHVSDFDVNANGKVSADGLTAGKWSGVFNFNIYMNSHEEYVLGDIILPDFLDDDYRLRIKKISNNPGLYDEEANLIANINTLVNDYDFDVSKNDSSAGDIINTNYPNADMLVLPSGTYSIGNNAFSNANLSYIELPNSVTSIGSNVFNSNIKYINIPKSVFRIGSNSAINKTAYYNNKPIKVITIDLENNDSVEIELEKGCRYEIEALYNFVNNVTNESTIISSDEKIVKFIPDCYLDAIEVGQCTISGTYTAKNGNQKYAEIKVNVIDNNSGNSSNTDIVKDNLSVSIEDGNTLTVGDVKNINVATTDDSTLNDVVITSSDENVAKIVDSKIEAVSAGNATITISADGSVSKTINVAVEEAQSLEAGLYDANDNLIVNWNDMVKATGFDIEKNYKMGDWRTASFYFVAKKYPNVRKVVIPEGTTHIGDYTFYLCSSSESIEIESIIIPSSVTSIGQSAFQNCTALKSIIIPNQVTKLNSNTFGGCSSLETVKLPDSLEHIENNVFGGCASLKSIIIPSSVTSISTGAFGGCSSLETVKLPDSLDEYIGTRLFINCISLKEIEIPNSVTTIGDYAFYGCEQLKTIKIPDSVEYIGSYALNCKELESVIIMNPSIELKSGVFYKCEKIKEITFNGTKKQWEKAAIYNLTYGNITPNVTVHCTDGDGDYLLNIR